MIPKMILLLCYYYHAGKNVPPMMEDTGCLAILHDMYSMTISYICLIYHPGNKFLPNQDTKLYQPEQIAVLKDCDSYHVVCFMIERILLRIHPSSRQPGDFSQTPGNNTLIQARGPHPNYSHDKRRRMIV